MEKQVRKEDQNDHTLCPFDDDNRVLLQARRNDVLTRLIQSQIKYVYIKPLSVSLSLVFRAIDTFTKRYVVLKCIEYRDTAKKNKSDLSFDPRSETESYLLNYFYTHPTKYIACPIDRFFLSSEEFESTLDTPFVIFVLHYYSNTLSSIDLRDVNPYEKKKWCQQIALALSSLHSLGFYYGDLKPSNICIEPDGYNSQRKGYRTIRLIDFGISSTVDDVTFIKSTIFYFTPIQAVNHSGLYDKRIFTPEYSRELREMLHQLTLVHSCLQVDPSGDGWKYEEEHGVRVDLFSFALMVIYIFGNHFLFYAKKVITDYTIADTHKMLLGCTQFCLTPNVFIDEVFYQLSDLLPPGWLQSLEMMLLQSLSTPAVKAPLRFNDFPLFSTSNDDSD